MSIDTSKFYQTRFYLWFHRHWFAIRVSVVILFVLALVVQLKFDAFHHLVARLVPLKYQLNN